MKDFAGNKSVDVTSKNQHYKTSFTVDTLESMGGVTFDDVYAFVEYPASDFYPIFSKPEFAEKMNYSCDSNGIIIDNEKQTVKAIKPGIYTVKATSDNFSGEFNVYSAEVDKTALKLDGTQKYNNEFASAGENRKSQWDSNGKEGKTTIFIGDSFFDTCFWSDFYETSYAGKDALCLGICSTTTYDWEQFACSWLAETSPENIVMHIGTNNVYDDGDNVEEAVGALQRMFNLIHDKLPKTSIYWFGITQRSYDDEKISLVSQINEIMKKWCSPRSYITYIDTPHKVTNSMLRDGVHPKVEYYSIFVDELVKTDIEI